MSLNQKNKWIKVGKFIFYFEDLSAFLKQDADKFEESLALHRNEPEPLHVFPTR